MVFSLESAPVVTEHHYGGSTEVGEFKWSNDGTFELTRTDLGVKSVVFYYRITDPTNLQSALIRVTVSFPYQRPLPVKLHSLTVNREGNRVVVGWSTATELNNWGFYVQRNDGQKWVEQALVPSASADGNSNTVLHYSYSDSNTNRGVSQYRLAQIDLDGKYSYSEIRMVAGAYEGKLAQILVYPNPTASGAVTIVFADQASAYDVDILDASGRQVVAWKNISTNYARVSQLCPGSYFARVRNRTNGKVETTRFVVIR